MKNQKPAPKVPIPVKISPPEVEPLPIDALNMKNEAPSPKVPIPVNIPPSEVVPLPISWEKPKETAVCLKKFLIFLSYLLFVITLPFSLFFTIKIVQHYQRAVIYRLGILVAGGAKGPGLFFILPCIDTYIPVDLRTVCYNVPPQEVLSKDSVTTKVDAVVFYRINNATDAINNVMDVNYSTQLLAQTILRNVLGIKILSEILSDRENIMQMMQNQLEEAANRWGVSVERVELKDVKLPEMLQRAMAAEAEASREAKAKIIAAEGEQKASVALKGAADVLSKSPGALQLRYLQTLNQISVEKNSTIVFPLPMELLSSFKS